MCDDNITIPLYLVLLPATILENLLNILLKLLPGFQAVHKL